VDREKRQQEQQNDPNFGHRHFGIELHPDSISREILPGNYVVKKSRYGGRRRRSLSGSGTDRTEPEKLRYTELVYGYFWMLKDLRRSDEKPILSNRELIPENIAKVFPPLGGLQPLSAPILSSSSPWSERLRVPDHFLRKNRSRDPTAQCTLVAVAYRDYGYQLLSQWIEPFERELTSRSETGDRIEIFRLNISEGFLNRWVLRGVIHGLMKRNTPEEDRDNTLLYFGGGGSPPEIETFRDALRMHNVMTGYVFLLDGLGRVRFAGSGPATDGETERLIGFANELLAPERPKQSQRLADGRGRKVSRKRGRRSN